MNYDTHIRTINIFIIIVTIIVAFIFFIFFIETLTQKDLGIKEVKCFDKKNNEIKGIVCKEEIKCGIIARTLNSDYCKGG